MIHLPHDLEDGPDGQEDAEPSYYCDKGFERVRKYLLAYKFLTGMLTEEQYRATMAGKD